MDTISHDNNGSYLPVAGLLAGVLGLLLGGVALYKVNSLGKRVPENLPDQLASLESSSNAAATAADKASKDIVQLTRSTQAAFDSIGPEIGKIKMSVAKLEETAKAEVFTALAQQNARTAARTPQSARIVARPLSGLPVSLGGGHWIETNADGEVITLEDGSIWAIDPIDTVDAVLWLPTSEITIIESNDGSPGYDYLLINTDDSEKAHAKYLGQR
jgi:hypothetical protein